MELSVKIGIKMVQPLRPLLAKYEWPAFRRMATRVYGYEWEEPSEYAWAKGLGTGLVIAIVAPIIGLMGGFGLWYMVFSPLLGFALGPYSEYQQMGKMQEEQQRETIIQFSRFASHCVLLMSSGMSVRHAFIKSTSCLEPCVTSEIIQSTAKELEYGVTLREAFEQLNQQLMHTTVAEFTSALLQMERYGAGAQSDLNRVIAGAWQNRRYAAEIAGKKLETKLIFPSMLVFSGVMLMVTAAMGLQLFGM